MLITQQSASEFKASLASGRFERAVVTLSPQAVASVAAHYRVSALVAYRRLVTYFKRLGVHHVFDSTAGSNISLLETAAEFVAHYRRHRVFAAGATSDGVPLGFVQSGGGVGGAGVGSGADASTASPVSDGADASGGAGGDADMEGRSPLAPVPSARAAVAKGGVGVGDVRAGFSRVHLSAADDEETEAGARKRVCVSPTASVVPLLSSACPG